MEKRNVISTAVPYVASPLSALCSGVMEAAWLTAVTITPCLHNPYTEFSFGPEKAALMHLLAALIGGAWICRLFIEHQKHPTGAGSGDTKSFWQMPVVWCVGALVIAYVLSTCCSVDPGQSLWGDYQTRTGTYTFGSYLLVFVAIATNLRRREQIDRFVGAVLVGSLPVSLYAIVQRLHLDPINWADDQIMRSLMGHPLYLAAYLAMVFSLSLWQVLRLANFRSLHPGGGSELARSGATQTSKFRRLELAFYCILSALQLAAFVLAQKRGPLIGLLAGLLFFLILISVCFALRRLLLASLVVIGLAGAFLVLLNIPGALPEALRSSALLDRFSHGLFSAGEGSGYFRADLWKQCPALMLSHQAVLRPDGTKDALHSIRPWLGYGPETTGGVLSQRYTVQHVSATLEDRFHNFVWDLWESSGGVGIAAFLVVFGALSYCGLRQLGLISARRDKLVFLALVFALSLGGAGLLSLSKGKGFFGLGLQVGLAAGCVAYPLTKLRANFQTPKSNTQTADSKHPYHDLLVIALVSACLMHLVETGFAFPTAGTATLFWAFAGLLLALNRQAGVSSEPRTQLSAQALQGNADEPTTVSVSSSPKSSAPGRKRDRTIKARDADRGGTVLPYGKSAGLQASVLAGCLTMMILLPLINLFLLRYTRQGLSSWDFIAYALDPSKSGKAGRNIVPDLLLAVWLGSALLMTCPAVISGPASGWLARYFASLLLSAGGTTIYMLWNSHQLARIGPLPAGPAEAPDLMSQAYGYESLYWVSMAVLLGLILVCAYAVSGLAPSKLRRPTIAGFLTASAALAAAVLIGMDLPAARAGISLRWAGILQSRRVWPACNEVFHRAVGFQPNQFVYRSRLARALRDQAEAATDQADKVRLFKQAEEVLLTAKTIPGYNRTAWHLGQLYLTWASAEPDPSRRAELAQKAKASLADALVWEPNNPPLWSDYGFVDLCLLHHEEEGLRNNQKALDIDPGCEQALGRLADFYGQQSFEAAEQKSKQLYARKAVEFYAQAAANSQAPFPYLMASGALLMNLQDWSVAIDRFTMACRFAPADQTSRAEEMLSRAYFAAGNPPAALQQLQSAIAHADQHQKPALLEFEKRLASEVNRSSGSTIPLKPSQ